MMATTAPAATHDARPAAAPARRPRAHSRHDALLAASARVFCDRGYAQATMRDIAQAIGMNAGSIYYHHASKGELLLAVYARGVDAVLEALEQARVRGSQQPWDVLERCAKAHLDMMLGALPGAAPFSRVFVQIQPHDFPAEHHQALVALRNRYEERFRELVRALPLTPGTDRSLLRLQLIGALNHVPLWWRPGGPKSLAQVARAIVRHLRRALDPGEAA